MIDSTNSISWPLLSISTVQCGSDVLLLVVEIVATLRIAAASLVAIVSTFGTAVATVVDVFTNVGVTVDVFVDFLVVVIAVVVVVVFVNSGKVRRMPNVAVGLKK